MENKNEKPAWKPFEITEAPAKEIRKKSFFRGLKSKFLAMATAGFITLGGGWEKGFADQLKIKVPEKKGATLEFVLETAITDEKLASFKENIAREEPEFLIWAEHYIDSLKNQLDKFIDSVLNYDLHGEVDAESEKNLRLGFGAEPETEWYANSLIEKDHRIVSDLKKNPTRLGDYREFTNHNIDKVVWGIIFMINSREVRDNMVRSVNSPEVFFSVHDFREKDRVLAYAPSISEEEYQFNDYGHIGKWNPQIKILPGVFETDEKKVAGLNMYLNIITHELVHALNSGADDKERALKRSPLFRSLLEGATQNISFELMQYLGTKDANIKPIVGMLSYDIRLLIASILESVFRAQQHGGDTLAKWHTAMIGDEDMLAKLKEALETLGLDREIATDVNSLNNPYQFEGDDFRGILLSMVARLKIKGVNLSPEFLKAIIVNNRKLNDWQVRKFEDTLDLGSVSTNASAQSQSAKKK